MIIDCIVAYPLSFCVAQPGLVWISLLANVTLAQKTSFQSFMATQIGPDSSNIASAKYTRQNAPAAPAYLPFMYNALGPELPPIFNNLLQTVDALELP